MVAEFELKTSEYHRTLAVLHEGCCYHITPSLSVGSVYSFESPFKYKRAAKEICYISFSKEGRGETDPLTFLSSQQRGRAKLWRSAGGGGRKFCRSVLVRTVGWWVVQAERA